MYIYDNIQVHFRKSLENDTKVFMGIWPSARRTCAKAQCCCLQPHSGCVLTPALGGRRFRLQQLAPTAHKSLLTRETGRAFSALSLPQLSRCRHLGLVLPLK